MISLKISKENYGNIEWMLTENGMGVEGEERFREDGFIKMIIVLTLSKRPSAPAPPYRSRQGPTVLAISCGPLSIAGLG